MYEEQFTHTLSSGIEIDCVLNSPSKDLPKEAVVIMHGLGCNYSSHPYPSATQYFVEKGYAVFRFNFCGGEKQKQNILDTTPTTLTNDLKEIIRRLQKDISSLYLVGHSYGGWLIMRANIPHINASSLWDPSYNLSDRGWAEGLEDDYNDRICVRWGDAYMFSKDMIAEEKEECTLKKCRELAKNFQTPFQVIHADKGILYKRDGSYNEYSDQPTDYHLIKGASHCFDELTVMPELFDKTFEWFQKWKV